MLNTKVIQCSTCKKEYTVYVIARADFPCVQCRTPIQYNLTGVPAVEIAEYEDRDLFNRNLNGREAPKLVKTNHFDWARVWVNAAIVLGVIFLFSIVVLAIGGGRSFLERSTTVISTPVNQNIPSPATSSSPLNMPPSVDESNSRYQLCSVRIVNTLQGTDKTGAYKGSIDVQSKTLTLSFINNPNEIITIYYKGGGINTFKLTVNGISEAEKTMYRRTDLESNDKEFIYTSRTEQIRITVKFD